MQPRDVLAAGMGRDLDAVGETMPSSIEMIQGYVDIYRHMVITSNPLE